MRLRVVPAIVAAFVQLAGRSYAQEETRPDLSGIRARLARLVAADSTPSLAVAVARNGAIVWEEAFGFADREHHVRATPQMSYAIASVSKAFTATELMVVASRRRIALNSPVNAYLSELPSRVRVRSFAWNDREVTIDRLAHHTAGLTTHAILCFRSGPKCDTSVTDAVARYGVAIRLPGERFDYSNLGYGLLGLVIEQVTHRPLGAALRRDLFAPLGMTATFIGPARLSPLSSNIAASYTTDGRREDGYHSSTPGASDGYSSVHDLATFGAFALRERAGSADAVLPDSLVDEVQRRTVRAGAGVRYGFGWWVDEDHYGEKEVYGAGGISVASAVLVLVPSRRLAVALTANTGIPLADIVDDVIAAFVPEFAARHRFVTDSAARHPSAPFARVLPAPALVGQWAGSIVTDRGAVPFRVSVDSAGNIQSSIGNTLPQAMTDVGFAVDGRLFGTTRGALPTPALNDRRYHIDVELAVHGARLTGYVTGVLDAGPPDGVALSYWSDLSKP